MIIQIHPVNSVNKKYRFKKNRMDTNKDLRRTGWIQIKI